MNEMFKGGTNPVPHRVSREAPLGSQAGLFSVLSACLLCLSPRSSSFCLSPFLPHFFFLVLLTDSVPPAFPKCRGPGPPPSLLGDISPKEPGSFCLQSL